MLMLDLVKGREWENAYFFFKKGILIFVIASSKNMVVAETHTDGNRSRGWNVNVARYLNDWEIKEDEVLLFLLSRLS